jgi:hypothetical protein
MMAPTEGQGGEDGASLDAQSVCSDFQRGFFTIFNNVLTVGKSAEGEERTVRSHPHSKGL